jgi:hypothetical protein
VLRPARSLLFNSGMSVPSSRPPVPRPTVRKTAPPPPVAAPVSAAPAAPPSSPAVAEEAYGKTPPVIRERMPTLELADDDLVEEQVVARPRATPPPPPPARSTVVPKLVGVERTVPAIAPMLVPDFTFDAPAPESRVQLSPAPVQMLAPVQQVRPKVESMLDPSEALFDGMYELNYADSHWQAARLCATALGRALGARTVIVHAHDLVTRELRTIGVHGEGEFDLLGGAEGSEDDLVASAVICNERAVTMRFDGELPRLAPKRLGMIAAPRTLVAVPAMAWGRCVALIEIIDADERLASRVAGSAAYVAERLAEFLSERAAA